MLPVVSTYGGRRKGFSQQTQRVRVSESHARTAHADMDGGQGQVTDNCAVCQRGASGGVGRSRTGPLLTRRSFEGYQRQNNRLQCTTDKRSGQQSPEIHQQNQTTLSSSAFALSVGVKLKEKKLCFDVFVHCNILNFLHSNSINETCGT